MPPCYITSSCVLFHKGLQKSRVWFDSPEWTHTLSAGSWSGQVLVWVLLVPAGAGGARHAATHPGVCTDLAGQAHLGQVVELCTWGSGRSTQNKTGSKRKQAAGSELGSNVTRRYRHHQTRWYLYFMLWWNNWTLVQFVPLIFNIIYFVLYRCPRNIQL